MRQPIWRKTESGEWELLERTGFPSEDVLHSLIESSPQVLPLAGEPTIAIVGREVRLGVGRIDLLAVETGGRPVIIEVKLKRNSEAKRAVVSQVLTYAAYLQGLSAGEFEQLVAGDLRRLGLTSVAEAAARVDDQATGIAGQFSRQLGEHLEVGGFRLVVVLDDVPPELLPVVSYLERITSGITIDLITVANYRVGGDEMLVPRRVDPDRDYEAPVSADPAEAGPNRKPLRSISGYEGFEEALANDAQLTPEVRGALEWAKRLAADGFAELRSYTGQSTVLIVAIPGEKAGLVSLYVTADGALSAQVQRTVFVRRAPEALADVEAAMGEAMGSGSKHSWTKALQRALDETYRTMLPPSTWRPGDWYINFGHDAPQRDWADARRFGYVSAGSGDFYSGPLKKLQPGDRVFVYVPKSNGGGGYVGYGEVAGTAEPAHESTLNVDGRPIPFFDLVPHAEAWNREKGSEDGDWVVPVRWIGTRDLGAAVTDRDFFANQNTVARLTHRYTRERVLAALGPAAANSDQ